MPSDNDSDEDATQLNKLKEMIVDERGSGGGIMVSGCRVVSAVEADPNTSQHSGSTVFVVELDNTELRKLAGLVEKGGPRSVVGAVASLADREKVLSAKAAGGAPGTIVWELR